MSIIELEGEKIRLSNDCLNILKFIDEYKTFKPVDIHLSLGMSYKAIHKSIDYLKLKGLIKEK